MEIPESPMLWKENYNYIDLHNGIRMKFPLDWRTERKALKVIKCHVIKTIWARIKPSWQPHVCNSVSNSKRKRYPIKADLPTTEFHLYFETLSSNAKNKFLKIKFRVRKAEWLWFIPFVFEGKCKYSAEIGQGDADLLFETYSLDGNLYCRRDHGYINSLFK